MLPLMALMACTVPTDNGPGACGVWFPDRDSDGYGDEGETVEVCAPDFPAAGLVTRGGDCNDANAAIRPGALEVCDELQVDENCSGASNDDDAALADGRLGWPDADQDGYGDELYPPQLYCEVPASLALRGGDCDDADPFTHRAAAEFEDPGLCTTDADEDGWGSTLVGPNAVAGLDCNDQDAAVYPMAPEWLGDGADQDCNGGDDLYVYDGFETGGTNPAVVDAVSNAVVTSLEGHGGTLLMGPLRASVVFRTLDTHFDSERQLGCQGLAVFFLVMQEDVPARDWLELQMFDGTALRPVWAATGDATSDGGFRSVAVALDDPAFQRSDFTGQLLTSELAPSSSFFIDDLWVGCTGLDTDGDGFGTDLDTDCDESDGRHWSDCGTCVDLDDDGYGADCNLGADCDDANPDAWVGC